jgi:hypothetical protein
MLMSSDRHVIDAVKAALQPVPEAIGGMKPHGSSELCSSCPWCGGRDRFIHNPSTGRSFCRKCWPTGGDLIAFHARLAGVENDDFVRSKVKELSSAAITRPKFKTIQGGAGGPGKGEESGRSVAVVKPRLTADEVKAAWERIVNTGLTNYSVREFLVNHRGFPSEFADHICSVHPDVHFTIFRRWSGAPGTHAAAFLFREIDGTPTTIQYLSLDEEHFPGIDDKRIFHPGAQAGRGFFFAGTPFQDASTVCVTEGVLDALAGSFICPEYCWAALGSANMTKKVKCLFEKDITTWTKQ